VPRPGDREDVLDLIRKGLFRAPRDPALNVRSRSSAAISKTAFCARPSSAFFPAPSQRRAFDESAVSSPGEVLIRLSMSLLSLDELDEFVVVRTWSILVEEATTVRDVSPERAEQDVLTGSAGQ